MKQNARTINYSLEREEQKKRGYFLMRAYENCVQKDQETVRKTNDPNE